jgi:S-adenosylmethionine hydrolase
MRIITFLSDFGEDDWFVAAVKGEILKINPNVHIIDITHRIKPHDISSAAFVLKSVFRDFPPGTIHLVVVDPGVGSKRKPIIVHAEPYNFIGPDNGVFSYIYDKHAKVYSIKVKGEVSATFHARDIFGPAAARLASGDAPSSFGGEKCDYISFEFPGLRKNGKRLYGEIVYIDHFGNLITNIPNDTAIRSLSISGKEVAIKNFYGEGVKGQIICVKGSSGYYEISCNKENAKELLSVDTGERVIAEIA